MGKEFAKKVIPLSRIQPLFVYRLNRMVCRYMAVWMGFSRKKLWFNVVKSNNNTLEPAYLCLNTVRNLCFCPAKLRRDYGENGIIVKLSSSLANQRIEMTSESSLIIGNHIHMECVWFVISKPAWRSNIWLEFTLHQKSRHGTYRGSQMCCFMFPPCLVMNDKR